MQRSSGAAAIPASAGLRILRLAAMAASIGATVVAVRIGLSLVGLHGVRRWMLPPTAPRVADDRVARQLCRRTQVAANFIPFASCLTRALACQILLARRGLSSTLCLGVRPGRDGAMLAHAWLVSGNDAVAGAERGEARLFTLLAELAPVRP